MTTETRSRSKLDTSRDGRVSVWLPGLSAGRHGGFSTLNISDWPNDAAVCSLSQVLWTGPIPPRYFLSGTACAGILRRAEKRGKTLPMRLLTALTQIASTEAAKVPLEQQPSGVD